MRRNGAAPRNPADVPCGGYPYPYELRNLPKGINKDISNTFYEFHRISLELQDISERLYRSHIDNSTNGINVKFLLGDCDEKHWGQQLAKNERKRKRDSEVQEIFAAYRMVAVELINRVQNYEGRLSKRPIKEIDTFLEALNIEIIALITMINDALRNVSISYSYSVPYIHIDKYYSIKTKNFSDEVKKKRGTSESILSPVEPVEPVEPIEPIEPVEPVEPVEPIKPIEAKRKKPTVATMTEEEQIQAAIEASFRE